MGKDCPAVKRRDTETTVLQLGRCVRLMHLQIAVSRSGKRCDLLPVVEREQSVSLRNEDPPIIVRVQEQLFRVRIGISAG